MAHRSDTEGATETRIDALSTFIAARYEWILVPVVMTFMFITRYLSRDNFASGETVYLAAVDSYYHWRTTLYTVEHWPNTMPFDVWTNFPDGRYVGQFGTGFDQIVATIAIIVGLGNPSEALVHDVVLVTIPLLAALVAIPVYLIGARLGGRLAGIGGVVLLALFPGTFFSRSAVGQHQHHVAEVLFMAVAILAFMIALRVAEREKPVCEQVVDRDIDGLRTTIGYSALAGVALAAYMWIWPPGTLLIGILGVFFVVYLIIEFVAGRSPEHLAFVGVIAFAVTGILMFGMIEEWSTSPTSFGYIAPVLALGVSGGSVVMAYLAREWESRQIDRILYPAGVAVSIVIALALLWLVLPDVVERMFTDVQRRMFPIGETPTDLTIQEANPPADYTAMAFNEFGLAFYTAIIGLIGMVVAPFLGHRARAEHGLIVIWTLFLLGMSASQVRFWYYMVLPMAILNAYLLGYVVRWADLEQGVDSLRNVEGYQIVTIAVILLVLFVPLSPIAGASVVDTGQQQHPHPDTLKWEGSLEWMETSTPEVGDWGGAGNQLEYSAPYAMPADGSYDYPEGSYGVMSWWDYGHLITTQSERIPRSNPFQTGAEDSSAFLLAESEERGSLILDAISTDESLDQETESLAQAMEGYDDDEIDDFRYVMIDDSMVGGKFGAIATWSDMDSGEYTTFQNVTTLTGQQGQAQVMGDRFYDTMVGSLMMEDASGMEQYRLVHESERTSTLMSVAQVDETGQISTIMVQSTPQSILQSFHRAGIPFNSIDQIIQHPNFDVYDIKQVPAVKTFERVEGATITGHTDAEPGSDVFASVRLNSSTERSFTYTQTATVEDDGTFTMTVPYATNNERSVEDGYTDSDVFAEDDYRISVFEDGNVTEEGTFEVPESAVYDGDEISVTLEEVEIEEEDEDEEEEDGENELDNGEAGEADEGNESSTNESVDE